MGLRVSKGSVMMVIGGRLMVIRMTIVMVVLMTMVTMMAAVVRVIIFVESYILSMNGAVCG
jgi:hypothetical protein